MSSAVLDAALTYASAGLHVFPLWYVVGGVCACGDGAKCENPAKHPLEWLVKRGGSDATTDPAVIRRWFETAPQANLGLVTATSGLVVLDVDVSGQKQGRESLAELDAELVPTLTAITGSGGIHAYYLRPPDMEPFTRIGARPGIDLIGNGYVVAPPSVHASGVAYRWANTSPMVPMPRVLRELRKPVADIKVDQLDTPIVEGGRNNSMFRLGAALRATGIDIQALRAAMHLENRRRFSPPLPDAEVDEVAVKVMRHAKVDRDVAASALVNDELHELFGTQEVEAPALWIRDVALTPGRPVRFYTTGNPQLDALLGGGIATSVVTGIIGPPSVGKSAYVGQLALELQKQLPVLSVSTELTRPDLMKRTASLVKGWKWLDAIKGNYDAELVAAVRDLQIKLVGTDQLDTSDPIGFVVKQALAIRDETRQMPAIILDYVQQLARGSEDGIRNRVGELTLKLRKVSQLLDTPVLAVFSTSREFYTSKAVEALRVANDPVGYLKAAKESGDIEYDCANLIYLDVEQQVEGLPKPARAVVARARVGQAGFAGYRAHLDVGRWVPDPLACADFVRGGSYKALAQQESNDLDEQLVIAAIVKTPGLSWAEYRDVCGISRQRAIAAKIRLLSSGQLVDTPVQKLDENKRMTTKHILSISGNKSGAPGV